MGKGSHPFYYIYINPTGSLDLYYGFQFHDFVRFLTEKCGSLRLYLFLVLFWGALLTLFFFSYSEVSFFFSSSLVISYCIIAYYYIILPKKPVHVIRDRCEGSWGVTRMSRGR